MSPSFSLSLSGVHFLPLSWADPFFPKCTFKRQISPLSVPLIGHLNCHLLYLKAMFPRKAECMSWVSNGVQTFWEAQGKNMFICHQTSKVNWNVTRPLALSCCCAASCGDAECSRSPEAWLANTFIHDSLEHGETKSSKWIIKKKKSFNWLETKSFKRKCLGRGTWKQKYVESLLDTFSFQND